MHKVISKAQKEYNSFDILKLALSVLVVIIHSGIDKTIISPIIRMAVPLFFIVSSYFFFLKLHKCDNSTEKRVVLLQTIKRNLLLYLFWSLIQLPIVIYARGYHRDFLWKGTANIVRDILIGSGFTGSWFIAALVIAIVVVFGLAKKVSATNLIVFSFPIYVFCCLTTNYFNLFNENSFVNSLSNLYLDITGWHFYTSFPAALYWVSIGRFMSEKKPSFKNSVLVVLVVLLSLLLAVERIVILYFNLAITDDCYFMLTLLCPIIFLLICKNKKTTKTVIPIRELSVLIYVAHGSLGRLVGYLVKQLDVSSLVEEVLKVIIIIIIITIISFLFVYLKERRGLKILKYAC